MAPGQAETPRGARQRHGLQGENGQTGLAQNLKLTSFTRLGRDEKTSHGRGENNCTAQSDAGCCPEDIRNARQSIWKQCDHCKERLREGLPRPCRRAGQPSWTPPASVLPGHSSWDTGSRRLGTRAPGCSAQWAGGWACSEGSPGTALPENPPLPQRAPAPSGTGRLGAAPRQVWPSSQGRPHTVTPQNCSKAHTLPP